MIATRIVELKRPTLPERIGKLAALAVTVGLLVSYGPPALASPAGQNVVENLKDIPHHLNLDDIATIEVGQGSPDPYASASHNYDQLSPKPYSAPPENELRIK